MGLCHLHSPVKMKTTARMQLFWKREQGPHTARSMLGRYPPCLSLMKWLRSFRITNSKEVSLWNASIAFNRWYWLFPTSLFLLPSMLSLCICFCAFLKLLQAFSPITFINVKIVPLYPHVDASPMSLMIASRAVRSTIGDGTQTMQLPAAAITTPASAFHHLGCTTTTQHTARLRCCAFEVFTFSKF